MKKIHFWGVRECYWWLHYLVAEIPQIQPGQKVCLWAPGKFFSLYSNRYNPQYSLKFPTRIVPTLLFLLIYVIMTSFPQKSANFLSFVDFLLYSFLVFLWLDLTYQTWVTQQVGHGQSLDGFMMSYNYNVTMQKQKCYRNRKKLPFWVVNSYNLCSIWCRALILLSKKVLAY